MRLSRGIATTALAVIVVIIVVVAGGAAYFALSGSSSPGTTTPTTANTSTNTSTAATSTPHTSTSASSTSATSSAATSSSTASSSTTQATSSTFSCSSTFTATTTGTPVDYTPQFIGLIKQFSEINFTISGTYQGKQEGVTLGYTSTSPSSGIYDATMTEVTNGTSVSFSFLVDSNNNTVLSASYAGYTITGAQAKTEFDAIMGIFGLNEYFSSALQVYTNPTYFTNQGTSTQTFGSVSFQVTTWVANTANEQISLCGVTATITDYTLKVGTPPGTSLQFIVYLHFAGTSQGQSEDVTFQLVSITVRS